MPTELETNGKKVGEKIFDFWNGAVAWLMKLIHKMVGSMFLGLGGACVPPSAELISHYGFA